MVCLIISLILEHCEPLFFFFFFYFTYSVKRCLSRQSYWRVPCLALHSRACTKYNVARHAATPNARAKTNIEFQT